MYRTDASHHSIKVALMKAGVTVRDVARHPGFGCDLLCKHVRRGTWEMLECKNPGSPSSQRLTESEKALRDMNPDHFHVVVDEESALRAVGVLG